MIKNFKDKDTEKVFLRQFVKKFPISLQKSMIRKLLMLNAATGLNDLKSPPGNNLEALKGNRNGQHSIRINHQWRVCFIWEGGHAYQVEIIDYH